MSIKEANLVASSLQVRLAQTLLRRAAERISIFVAFPAFEPAIEALPALAKLFTLPTELRIIVLDALTTAAIDVPRSHWDELGIGQHFRE